MNEVDDQPILFSPSPCFEYLEAWKFAEVGFIINFSLSRDGSFLTGGTSKEFELYWPYFIQQFWFAAEFLSNVFAGVAFAMDYIIRRLKSLYRTKRNVHGIFSRSLAYLFF